jgi:hypothetical protein
MRVSLTQIESVLLPLSVATVTHRHLHATGLKGLEGMALWTGIQEGSVFHIREAVIPKQEGIRSDHGLAVMVSAPELHRINLHLYKNGLRLLAQIHSHPTEAYHSAMDDEYAIATALGAFSLVVPDFARQPFSIAQCATYRLTKRSWWNPGPRPHWAKVPLKAADAIFTLVGDR